VQGQEARAEVLAGLEAVDVVVIFEEDTPLELLKRVRRRSWSKGPIYRIDQVVGRELVEANGGEVVLVDLVPGYSTTNLIKRRPAAEMISRFAEQPAKDQRWNRRAFTAAVQ